MNHRDVPSGLFVWESPDLDVQVELDRRIENIRYNGDTDYLM